MVMNEAGQIGKQCWLDIPRHFPCVELDVFVIMPNHFHGIIAVGARHAVPLHEQTEQ
jgi:REP element-mobilizing transposase RayT